MLPTIQIPSTNTGTGNNTNANNPNTNNNPIHSYDHHQSNNNNNNLLNQQQQQYNNNQFNHFQSQPFITQYPPPQQQQQQQTFFYNTNTQDYNNPLQSNTNNTNNQLNTQQISEIMYNSFLSQLSQKQVSNALSAVAHNAPVFSTAATSNATMSGLNPSIATPVNQNVLNNANQQRYFHTNLNLSSSLLDSSNNTNHQNNLNNNNFNTNGATMTQTMNLTTKSSNNSNTTPQPKKLSTTQSRIEKRKQLKKQGPKRPSSAYFLFSMSIRNDLLQKYPQAKVPELSKLASAKWKELTDLEKKPFYDEFKTNWEKYRILRQEYEKTLPPKRPSGPFIQFTQEIRPDIVKQNPDKNLIEITKIIGEKWRSLAPERKARYTEEYRRRLKEWESFYPEEDEI